MLIQVDDVYFAYPGGVQALDGVSLGMDAGEQVALVGENGSGKTTLAPHLNGLLLPQRGSVRIGDWLTSDHSPAQIARLSRRLDWPRLALTVEQFLDDQDGRMRR